MIPIGTRCVLVRAWPEEWLPHVGKTVRVVRHWRGNPKWHAHIIEFEDGTQILDARGIPKILHSDPPDIIPIGHDPDAETRKTEREVEA